MRYLSKVLVVASGLMAIVGLQSSTLAQMSATVARAGEHHITVILHDGAVYIHGSVNGSRATLLLDTGAALTTLSLKLVPAVDSSSRITAIPSVWEADLFFSGLEGVARSNPEQLDIEQLSGGRQQ